MANIGASPPAVQAELSLQHHVKAINALEEKIQYAEGKIDQYRRAQGRHIAVIKKASPADWLKIVEAECHFGRSRAYELLQIADGTKTTKQIRDQTNKRYCLCW